MILIIIIIFFLILGERMIFALNLRMETEKCLVVFVVPFSKMSVCKNLHRVCTKIYIDQREPFLKQLD